MNAKPKPPPINTKPCSCCHGTGTEYDNALVGAEMRALRHSKKLSMKSVSAKMGVCEAIVCDLEKGHRKWTPEKLQRYKAACV